MSESPKNLTGPDFTRGVAYAELVAAGKLSGQVGDEEVLLVLSGEKIFAVGAHCTHYHAPLVDGLVVDGSLRCPWHHVVFDLSTGEALSAPAFGSLSCWEVERRCDEILVRKRRGPVARARASAPSEIDPKNIVIVGGGAAGFAAVERLRREGYGGKIVMVSNDPDPPTDRPNLSKDYLAGNAPEEWLPLGMENFHAEQDVQLRLGARVTSLDPKSREITLADGARLSYDRLLLATAPNPFVFPSPAPICRMSARSGRWPTVGRSLNASQPQGEPSCSERVSSALKSRRHCEGVESKSMSSRRRSGQWSAHSACGSAILCVTCMRSAA